MPKVLVVQHLDPTTTAHVYAALPVIRRSDFLLQHAREAIAVQRVHTSDWHDLAAEQAPDRSAWKYPLSSADTSWPTSCGRLVRSSYPTVPHGDCGNAVDRSNR